MNTEVLYSVTWRDSPYGPAWTLDGYDKAEIMEYSVWLAEHGREVEPLLGPIEVPQTKADIEAMERVREKLFARIASDRAIQIVQERQARKSECEVCHVMFEATPTKEMVG